MPRADLLALSSDDLATLTNRGIVKRAQRDLDSGISPLHIDETPAGDVRVQWPDGVECLIPAGQTLRQGRCSCAAVGVCRHLVLSVLAYQRQAVPAAVEPWDPGAIADEELARHFRPAQLARLREQFEQGVLAELVRSSKPSARLHLQGCLVRFLVPGDVRYTHCDCAEAAPCAHVPLAVWAFRQLPPSAKAGILSSSTAALPVPVELLDNIEETLLEFCEQGVSGVPAAWKDRLGRLARDCDRAELVWPAEVLGELIEQQEKYHGHDARFAPDQVAELIGELAARCDAIRNDTGALPQLLIRGAKSDRATTLDTARFIGLGCGVHVSRRRVELAVFLQDSDSGTVMVVQRDIVEAQADPAQPQRSFAELALRPAVKGTSFAALGAGQLLIRGGKRTARCTLEVGRAAASVQPQAYNWETLRPPVLVEEFAELQARLSALPPSALRPRRLAEDFHVCAVTGAVEVRFEPVSQTIQATLLDARRQKALLLFPFTSRARQGAEALLAQLGTAGARLRFVSGPVRRSAAGLVIEPVCLVFLEDNGRTAFQPWVEARPVATADALAAREQAAPVDPVVDCLEQVQAGLEELLVLGLQRADGQVARRWRELQERAEATGLARLGLPARQLAELLEQKAHTLRWDWRPAARLVLHLAVLLRLAWDVTA
jgi:hypothetical protein